MIFIARFPPRGQRGASRNPIPVSGRCPEALLLLLGVPGARRGIPLRYARDLRPLAADSARRNSPGTFLIQGRGVSPPNAPRNPPLRPLAPGATNGYVAVFMKRST